MVLAEFRRISLIAFLWSAPVLLLNKTQRALAAAAENGAAATSALGTIVGVGTVKAMASAIPQMVATTVSLLTSAMGIGVVLLALFMYSNRAHFPEMVRAQESVVEALLDFETRTIHDPSYTIRTVPLFQQSLRGLCGANATSKDFRDALASLQLSTGVKMPALFFFRPNGVPRKDSTEICRAIHLYTPIEGTCSGGLKGFMKRFGRLRFRCQTGPYVAMEKFYGHGR